jgi:SAM-dependent methyltransferase
VIADIGAGDGRFLYAMSRHGRLGAKSYAIDVSPERVAAAVDAAPDVVGVVADATSLPLEDESVERRRLLAGDRARSRLASRRRRDRPQPSSPRLVVPRLRPAGTALLVDLPA